jgi:hypothetical protein
MNTRLWLKYIGGLLIFTVIIVVQFLFAIRDDRNELLRQRQELLTHGYEQWVTILEQTFEIALCESDEKGEAIASDIIDSVPETMIYDELRTLNDEDNLLYPIFRKHIEHQYFMNIKNDANDMFLAIGGNEPIIAADYSINCAAEDRTRTFNEEIAGHANPELASYTFQKLLTNYDGLLFFQYVEDPLGDMINFGNGKTYQHLLSYDINGLKDLYFRNNGDWEHTFGYYEFLAKSFVYDDMDMSGELVVSARGMKQDAKIIIPITVFNLSDVIKKKSSRVRATLDNIFKEVASIDNELGTMKMSNQIDSIITYVLGLMIFGLFITKARKKEED